MPGRKLFGNRESEFVVKRHTELASFFNELFNVKELADQHIIDFLLRFNVDYNMRGEESMRRELH